MGKPKMIREGDDMKGGSGKTLPDGSLHFTNFTNSSRTSWDEDPKGNVSKVHSVDSKTKEKVQHGNDSSVLDYTKERGQKK